MKIAMFSTKPYDAEMFKVVNQQFHFDITYFDMRLDAQTVCLAAGFDVVCVFVNDQVTAEMIAQLVEQGTKLLALRSAGYNHIDLRAADSKGITVARVPAYSPYAVAEHAVTLMLSLNRKIYRAYNRVREGNFSLEGLLGFDMHGKTVGIVGMGQIGLVLASILKGFGCEVLAYDPFPQSQSEELGLAYCTLPELYRKSDIISLHCPLTPETRHLINETSIAQMKDGVMLINTSRGAVVDTYTVLQGLKTMKIGYLGLDVYEEEADLFFEDLSNYLLQDDIFARLLTFPNVLITGHQAFFTREALHNIAFTTLQNIHDFQQGSLKEQNSVKAAKQFAI